MPVQQNSTNLFSEPSQLDIQCQRRRPEEFNVSNQQKMIWKPVQPAPTIGDSEVMAHSQQPQNNPAMSTRKIEQPRVTQPAYTNATLLNPLCPVRAQRERDIRTEIANPRTCAMLQETSTSTYSDQHQFQSLTTNNSQLKQRAAETYEGAGNILWLHALLLPQIEACVPE